MELQVSFEPHPLVFFFFFSFSVSIFFFRYCNYLFRETQTNKVDKTKTKQNKT